MSKKKYDKHKQIIPCAACSRPIGDQKKKPIFKPTGIDENGVDHLEGFPYDEQEDLCSHCKSKIRMYYADGKYVRDHNDFKGSSWETYAITCSVDDSDINELTIANLQYDGFID